MAEQLSLTEEFDAYTFARKLQDTLETSDEDEVALLTAFHASMAGYPVKSYQQVHIVGRGLLHEVFLWCMPDESFLVVGWASEDEVIVGVLPPGSEFKPLPFADGKIQTIH